MARGQKGTLAFLIGVITLHFLASPGHARKTAWATRVCPLTDTSFPALVEASGYQSCLRLDLKPIGSIGAPSLVPVCPDDGFVVYKNRFSEREKTLLRDWARSREFKIAIQRKSTYFRMALIQEKLSEPALDIAHSYLAASWEVEFDAARYSRYVGLALAKLQLHLQGASFDTPSKQDRSIRAESMLLAAELNRRIGRFDEARRLLLDIPGDLAAERKDIIDYELELLDRRDSEPHYLPRDEDARCASLDRKHPEPAPQPSDAYVPPPPTRSPGPLPAHKLRR